MRFNELPPDEMPREKLLKRGLSALSDAELLALLVRSGTTDRDVLELSRHLIAESGGLVGLSRMDAHELQDIPGIGPAKSCELAAVFELGRRALEQKIQKEKVDSPEAVYALMAHQMAALRQESVRVILLNTRHRLMRIETVSTGSVNESIADPREIFRPAIIHNAHAIILVHNHPSGDPSPSETDRKMTARMLEISQLMRVQLLDHVIIGSPSPEHPPYFSFKEAGLL